MSDSVDLKEVAEKFKDRGVFEVSHIVGIWEVNIDECPVNPLRIKIISYVDGMFLGVANYLIRPPGQSTPQRSLRLMPTAQEAFEEALAGFLNHFDPEKVSNTTFLPDEEF